MECLPLRNLSLFNLRTSLVIIGRSYLLFEIDLPDNPVRYTAVPDAIPKDGIWGEAGINRYNVAMSETETITTNSRVLGADPLVESGIGEEDMLTLVLPYVQTAREGVLRLGNS